MITLAPRFTTVALIALISCASHAAPSPTQTTTTTYDAAGRVLQIDDGMQHITNVGYDALSRRSTVTDAKNGVTKYRYDLLDQLTEVTDARLVVTTYTIDGLGNLKQTLSSDAGPTDNGYDEAGNLSSRIDAKQQRTSYKYDVLNRLQLVTYHDNTTVAYLYDQGLNGVGQLSKITDVSGTIEFGYDAFGRIATETRTMGGATYTTGYRYDDTGRLSGMRYPTGRDIEFVRDALGRISGINTSVSGTLTALLSNVIYQPFGPVQKVTFGNGRSQSRTYDLDGRIESFSLAGQVMGLTYDAASRITGITDAASPAASTSYGYDALDRLTNVTTPSSSQAYEYDVVGNRQQKVNNSVVTPYKYDGPGNRLTQVGAQAITADVNGSITNKGNATFNYDARGRMVSANTTIGLVQYTINSLGQRVRKVTPTETTVFHYDVAGKLIAESTTTGSVTTTQEYVYLGDMPVAVLK